jgi:CDP-diglyceride synthetase
MINWQSVIFNSFWIFGLALLLAAFSYHYWEAAQNNRSLRVQLSQPAFLRFFWLAIFLVSIGLIGTSQQLWEMAIWGGLALFALFSIFGLSRKAA